MHPNKPSLRRLRTLCFILNVVLPLVILAVATIYEKPMDVLEGWVLVGGLPVTGVYWGILFLNFSPKNPQDIFRLLLPFFISVIFGLSLSGIQSTWNGFIVEASILYTALTLCFLSGLAQLCVLKVKDRGLERGVKYSLVYLTFLIFLGVPAVFLSFMGLDLMPLNRLGVGIYFAQVVVMTALYHPMLVQLYHENKV